MMTNATSRPVFHNLVTRYECCVLNSAGTLLIVLMHVTIQVVYCHYMNNQVQAMVVRINVLQYNKLVFRQ